MDSMDFRFITIAVFAAVFGVFGIYHLLSYLILKHKILLYYFILILGLTLHWSLYFFIDDSFGKEVSKVADKASLTTAMLTTFGLLMFTKNYLNIGKEDFPMLAKTYGVFSLLVVCLPVMHLLNNLTIGSLWFNDLLVMLAAMTAMASVFLNIFSGIRLFNAQKFNRYYLYSYAPILLAAILYIGTWFLKRHFDFNPDPIILASSILVTLQLILFSLLVSFKFKSIEDENRKMQMETNKMLVSEVDRRTKDLQIANRALEDQNAELEKVNKLKNKLFSVLTHDVRAPLNNVNMVVEMIQDDLGDGEMKKIMGKLKTEISDKITMVNGLLQWSYKQLEGVQLNKKECDLDVVLTSIKQEFERIAKDKDLGIELNVNCQHLFVDESMLKVMLRNLTSNAIKFSEKGQRIVLWSLSNPDYIDIGVRDFGRGLDPDWFGKIESGGKPMTTKGTKGEKGTGFGLLITKDFVELNGGEIICESEIGKGTNFILRFKRANS